MPIIQWNDSYAVGHGVLDKQHRRVFEIMNELYDAVQNGNCIEHARKLADEIIVHAAEHFELEEKLMEAANYPGLAEHAEEHRKVRDRAIEYRDQMLDGTHATAVRMLNFIKDWILDHLVAWDREYVPYISE